MQRNTNTQHTVLTDWQALAISRRQTRQEKREFPRQIPNVFARAETLPTRLVRGLRWVKSTTSIS